MVENQKDVTEDGLPQTQEIPDQVTQVDAGLEVTKKKLGIAAKQSEHCEPVKAAYFVKIWLVTGTNHDRKDIIAGGSTLLGPYMWVHESYKDRWAEDMQRKYGNRVNIYVEPGRQLFECEKIPSYEDQMKKFEEYLSSPSHW